MADLSSDLIVHGLLQYLSNASEAQKLVDGGFVPELIAFTGIEPGDTITLHPSPEETLHFKILYKEDNLDTGFTGQAIVQVDESGAPILDAEGNADVRLVFPGFETLSDVGSGGSAVVGNGNPQRADVALFMSHVYDTMGVERIVDNSLIVGSHSMGCSNALEAKHWLEERGRTASLQLLEPFGTEADFAMIVGQNVLKAHPSITSEAAFMHLFQEEAARFAQDILSVRATPDTAYAIGGMIGATTYTIQMTEPSPPSDIWIIGPAIDALDNWMNLPTNKLDNHRSLNMAKQLAEHPESLQEVTPPSERYAEMAHSFLDKQGMRYPDSAPEKTWSDHLYDWTIGMLPDPPATLQGLQLCGFPFSACEQNTVTPDTTPTTGPATSNHR